MKENNKNYCNKYKMIKINSSINCIGKLNNLIKNFKNK